MGIQEQGVFGRKVKGLALALMAMGLSACGQNNSDSKEASAEAGNGEVVVFSARKQHLVEPLFNEFTKETGIKVNFITDSPQPLLARIGASQDRVEADVFIAVDAGSLWSASNQELLEPANSETLKTRVPTEFQEPNGMWYGLSKRARTIVYSTERVEPESLSSYEQLADAEWKGRLCLRTSQKVYNQSLVGMLIEEYGEPKVKEILKGWVDNLAAPVFSSDTLLIQAITSGMCDVGIVNTYYLGQELATNPDLPVKIHWANQASNGVHVNISGAGIVKNAPHRDNAVKLLEFLVSDTAQKQFAGSNYEYPVVENIPVDPVVAKWGEFKGDKTPIAYAGENQAKAIMLMDQVGYQ